MIASLILIPPPTPDAAATCVAQLPPNPQACLGDQTDANPQRADPTDH